MSLNLKSNSITSAPVSPARGVSGLLSRATSITGSVTSTVKEIARATSQVAAVIKDRYKILLIIDDHLVDWSKYFRGRRLIGDWDIKVEQAEFKDINLTASSELGALVSIHTYDRNGYKIARTFRPDFVLVRQHIQDANQNYSNIVVGLKYGLVPSINSLQSFYNFQDKAWVFANLLALQRKHGKDNFPLIEQTYYQTYKDTSGVPKIPCVVKIGSSSSGTGKVKLETIDQYQDIRSILMITNTYCTLEPFIDAKCDLIVQKIGSNYKVFSRKSVSGNWKANIGAAIIEPMSMQDRYKKWIDEVSDSFGGLDICSLEGVISKDGKELIFKVRGSDMGLLGESQDEDRKNMVELIVQRMNAICKNILIKQQSRASIPTSEQDHTEQIAMAQQQSVGKRSSITSMSNPASNVPPQSLNRRSSKEIPKVAPRPPPPPPKLPNPPPKPPPPQPPPLPPTASSMANTINATSTAINTNSTNPFASEFPEPMVNEVTTKPPIPPPSSQGEKPVLAKRDSQSAIGENKEEADDTMRNLRKTFAGIFGDM